jgi:serine/threonine-protein kinase
VNITVCTAPTTTAVPNVVGKTVANATAALQAAGLTVGSIVGVRSCDVLANNIVSQSPRAGTIVSIGSAVNLVKSLGPPPKNPCP